MGPRVMTWGTVKMAGDHAGPPALPPLPLPSDPPFGGAQGAAVGGGRQGAPINGQPAAKSGPNGGGGNAPSWRWIQFTD
jgi:hypothetical protein